MKEILKRNPYGEHATAMLSPLNSPSDNVRLFSLEFNVGALGEMFIELNSKTEHHHLVHLLKVECAKLGKFGVFENRRFKLKEMVCPLIACHAAEQIDSNATIYLYPRREATLAAFQQLTRQQLSLLEPTKISSGEILSTRLSMKAQPLKNTSLTLPNKML